MKLHFPEKSLSYRFVCFGYGDVILENGLFYAEEQEQTFTWEVEELTDVTFIG